MGTSKKVLSIFLMAMLIMLNIINVTEVRADETYNFINSWKTGDVKDDFDVQFLAVDSLGNVYAADEDNNTIEKYDSNGKCITKWKTRPVDNGGFGSSNGIAVDSSGNVYVALLMGSCIQKYDSNGNYITQIGTEGNEDGQFNLPNEIAVDSSGNIYVIDHCVDYSYNSNKRIQKFNSNGDYVTEWKIKINSDTLSDTAIPTATDIAVDSSGNVYTVNQYNNRIEKYDSNGNYITQWGTKGNENGQFHDPYAIAIDASGDVYVTELGNNHIQKFSQTPTKSSSPIMQTIVLNNGNSSDLTKYLNSSGTNVTWKSSNTNVATVNNGIVTALSIGSSIVSAVGQDGTQYGTFTINVTNNNVTKSDLNTIRLGGQDRYETSAVISQAGWKNGSTYAVIADGDNYPDALSAAPLAKKYNAPILLTNTSSIPQSILNEIKRLNVNHIFICGGTAVVSKDVENQLNSMGITTERLGGKDRYETSVLIAQKLGVVSGEVMATNGYEWSDALSASSIAAKKGIPIILTDKDVLPDSTSSFLRATNFSKTYILGDTDLVSDNVANKFPNKERIVGITEYERNINIIKRFQNDIDFNNICIASGNNFPDALSGSALATMVSSATVLVDNSDLQSITTEYASKNLMKVNNVYVFGLQGSVNDDIVKKLFNK